MSDLIKKIKIKKQDGTYTDYIPIGAEAKNVDCSDGESVEIKLSKKPYYYNNIADMKADIKLKAGDMAITLGYYEANDGGGAEYKIVDGNYIDDGGSYHKLNNRLFAKLIIKLDVNVRQFGAKNDINFNSSPAFQNAMNAVYNNPDNNVLNIPSGRYYIATTLDVPRGIRILGSNKTMYNERMQKAAVLFRDSDIVCFSLVGEYDDSEGGKTDIEISNLTFTYKNGYSGTKTNAAIKTQRSLYCHYTDLVFKGGTAFYLGKGSFDSRVYNCDFVNSNIETEATETDEYHDYIYYGINQFMFFGCRFEGGNIDRPLLKFGAHTREMYFYGTKFEVTMQDNIPLWDFSQGAGDVFMQGVRITFNAGHLGYLGNFNGVTRSFFDITCVDNAVASNYPYFKIKDSGNLTMTFYLSKDLTHYNPDYFIDNLSSITSFNLISNVVTSSYYSNAKALYSNPSYQNKDNILLNTTSKTSDAYNAVKFKITKEGEDTKTFNITQNWESFANNRPRLVFSDNDGTCMVLRNSSIFSSKGLTIPYLSSQFKNYINNGDLFINKYSDSNIPLVSFGIEGASKRIGWNNVKPTTGTHTKGTIVFNSNPIAGGEIGWVCTAAGTPGIWKSFGTIEN